MSNQYIANGPFTMSHFSNFFIQTKKSLNAQFTNAKFSELYVKFCKNPLKTHKNTGPQICQFVQRNVCQEASLYMQELNLRTAL